MYAWRVEWSIPQEWCSRGKIGHGFTRIFTDQVRVELMRGKCVGTRFCSTREHATKNLVDSPAGICTERAQEKNSRQRKL